MNLGLFLVILGDRLFSLGPDFPIVSQKPGDAIGTTKWLTKNAGLVDDGRSSCIAHQCVHRDQR